jgi:hypothetical protein
VCGVQIHAELTHDCCLPFCMYNSHTTSLLRLKAE